MINKFASDILNINRFGKIAERNILNNFLKRLQINPNQIEESERPDFFISLPSAKIGIEITHYHSDSIEGGSIIRRRFEIWSSIANKLKNELKKSNLPNIYGVVSLKETVYKNIWNINQKKFINELINLCKKMNAKSPRCFNILDFSVYPYLNKLVEHIYINILSSKENPIWWCSHLQSGAIKDPISIIPSIIKTKLETGKKYNWKNTDGQWLLIAALAFNLSDIGIITKEGIKHGFDMNLPNQEVFDRIYYWDKFSEDIWELYPEKRVVFEVKKKSLYINRFPEYLKNYYK